MLERIVAAGLHIQVIVASASLALLLFYCRLIVRTRWFGKDQLNDRVFHEHHEARVVLLIGIPGLMKVVLLEELIFRVPLILVFEEWNRQAWPWVALSSVLFGFAHYCDNKFARVRAYNLNTSIKDELGIEVNDLHARFRLVKERTPMPRKYRLLRGSITGCLGLGFAYLGITHQSLYIVVGVHLLWNTIIPDVSSIFTLLLIVLITPYFLVKGGWNFLMAKFDALKGR